MSLSITVAGPLWEEMRIAIDDRQESAGIALATLAQEGQSQRLLIAEIRRPTPSDYVERTDVGVVLSSGFVARVVADARRTSMVVIFFHTHPFADDGHFSSIDDQGEVELHEFLERRLPNLPHCAVVLGRKNVAARRLGGGSHVEFRVVGEVVRRIGALDKMADLADVSETHDRQIRVFGASAQASLGALRVAVVGLGGTGSIVVQQLAHLGVRRFLLMDPDTVELSNLNRVVGAERTDATRAEAKVDVARRAVLRIEPRALVETSRGSVLSQREARSLIDTDAVFACTDSHGSRYVLNQIAYQYLVPVFDVGVVIAADFGRISHIFGRAQMLAPGLACLTCTRILDPEQVRRDLLTDFERKRDPYVLGAEAVPQPAVISINATVASMAVTLFLSGFAGVPVAARHQIYDAIRGVVRPIANSPLSTCVTCSSDGVLAQGDRWPTPGRAL